MPPCQELASLVLYLVQFTPDENHPRQDKATHGSQEFLQASLKSKLAANFSPCALCTLYAAFKKNQGEFLCFARSLWFDTEMQGTTTCLSPSRSRVPVAPTGVRTAPTHPQVFTGELCTAVGAALSQQEPVQDVASQRTQPGCVPPPGLLTDLQLPLNPALAALPVVSLSGVVLGHHLHKLARQRRVLRRGEEERVGVRVVQGETFYP